jgi:predicted ATPase
VASELIAGISSLVAKSLVVHGVQGVARYRLLDTSHAYAIEKLDESGEREHVARRHAEYYRELFERAETEWQVRPAAEWLSEYGWSIDNLRAALDWAFSAGGDASLGVALTAAAAPLWMHLSLLGEYRGRVERSLAALAGKDARLEMRLNAALGASLVYSGGAAAEIEAAWRTTHHLAIGLGDVDYQLRSLWGLWLLQHVWLLQHPRALATARQFSAMAAAPADRLVGERMLGVSYHHLGDLSRARRHLERVDIDDVVHDSASGIGRFQVDQRPAAHTYLARILWLQGLPARATRLAESTVERARAADHANSLCHALALAACPIAVWVGNLHLAERHVALLDNYSERHALALWRPFVSVHRGLVSIRRGDVRGGLRGLRTGLDAFDAANTGFGLLMFTGDLAAALGLDGQVVEGLAAVNEAIDRSTGEQERWMLAELLRIRGELLLSLGGDDATTAAEEQFRKALEWARRQGGLSWELRAATSLARLLSDRGRPRDALAYLQPVFARFTEEFDTADLATAKLMLNELR